MFYGLKDKHGEYIDNSSKFWGTSRVIYNSDINEAYMFATEADAKKALVRVHNLFTKQQKEIAETGQIKNYRLPATYNMNGIRSIREYAEVEIVKLVLVESP